MEITNAECSACVEMLFTDQSPDFVTRIGLAAAAGFAAIEFWHWSNKDLDAVAVALRDTGLTVAGFVAEPMTSLNDPANHDLFLDALPASVAVAKRLGAPFLYIQGGSTLPDVPRAAQTAALTQVLIRAADVLRGTGVTLLLEPVSDAKNGFLTHAADGLAIVAAVNRPEVRLLYDLFHAAVAGEPLAATVGPNTALIGHVHVADHPGRGGPGTGTQDLSSDLAWLRAHGYSGLFGMEHQP
jgi:hydroxypyruvate isomerase